MWNTPKQARLDRIPRLHETDSVSLEDKQIHLHFFVGGNDWYIAEYDGEDTFFGYVVLNSNMRFAEWGYISFSELKGLRVGFAEVDCEHAKYFPVQRFSDIKALQKRG